MGLIEQIAAAENIQAAWTWLASRRKDSHHNNDYWHLRHHRPVIEPQLVAAILDGSYQFSPCNQYESALVWCAQDALVLRAMAQVLSPYLNPQLSQHCFHLAGNGGAKGLCECGA